ncbi:MAG: hypothetical protein O7B79_03305 [SAR324 cluster bacterium]|nr:hypothetical protein [SAR324 cluster bacterium]
MGIPTVTICSDAFINLGREESRNLGMPDLPLAIIKHPLGGEPEEVVRQRAADALEQVVQGLTQEPR